jgi:hypothetical protein
MHYSDTSRAVLGAARRHPWRALLAVCVPVAVAVASVITGTTMASAQPDVTLAIPAAAATAAPAAHIIPDVAQSLSKPVTDVKAGAVQVAVPVHMTGCDTNYGAPNQCVPLTIPGTTAAAKCAWLKSMGLGALQVVGTNDQSLAENAEGYVCGSPV